MDGQDVQDGVRGQTRGGSAESMAGVSVGDGYPDIRPERRVRREKLLISAHRPRFTSGIGPPREQSDCSLLLIRCSFPVHFCSLLLITAHVPRGCLYRRVSGVVPSRQPAYAVGAGPRKGRVSRIRESTGMHRMDRMRSPTAAVPAHAGAGRRGDAAERGASEASAGGPHPLLRDDLSPQGCIDRGHPLHLFGDMVYTFCPPMRRQEVRHSLEGGVSDVPEA